jgi:GT2 family glycosyltransferase
MSKERILVLGLMSHYPVAGVAWQTLHYLIGFQRLGYDVFYVEAHDCTPTKLMQGKTDDGVLRAAEYIGRILRRFELDGRWAYHSVSQSRCFGLTRAQLQELYRSADVIVNLHGSHVATEEMAANGRLVFLETDPVEVQIDLYHGKPGTIEYLEPHGHFFTFGENIGRPGCLVPVPDPFRFHATRQPVVLDFWRNRERNNSGLFTTIGNWRQPSRVVEFQGEAYHWSKHFEFEKFLDLPRHIQQQFELALSSSNCDASARQMLETHGWRVRDALEFSADLDGYRSYICQSRGEFTVAKDQNVRLRSGWFSDRAATYLAAGRPVITQETGFSQIIPTGEGLFSFSSMEEVTAAIDAINSDYPRHSRAALEIAHEYFSHEVVLTRLLADVDRGSQAMSPDTVIVATSRWPTRLPEETINRALALSLFDADQSEPHKSKRPRASVVIVTYNGLPYTKMCVSSVLKHDWNPDDELIIVDNASSDGTAEFLRDLSQLTPSIRLALNSTNRGFAAANNQGLAMARGEILVLLNNDTIVTRGWLDRLANRLRNTETGIVGPVTNRTCNEAQIHTSYRTLAEMEAFADEYTRAHEESANDIAMLAMFCMAMRRDVFERVGLLDEQFEVGMFEDDDYSRRIRQAGYRVICAEDVFVHHFGQAAFGELCADGQYDRILESNRQRFEAKWSVQWQPHGRRITADYVHLRKTIQKVIAAQLPPGETVLVISKGDEELLHLEGREGWHFPRDAEGHYPSIYPADSAEAITQLEHGRANGAGYLLIPKPAFWWLDFYAGFKDHLERNYTVAVHDEDTCVIFDVRPATSRA